MLRKTVRISNTRLIFCKKCIVPSGVISKRAVPAEHRF